MIRRVELDKGIRDNNSMQPIVLSLEETKPSWRNGETFELFPDLFKSSSKVVISKRDPNNRQNQKYASWKSLKSQFYLIYLNTVHNKNLIWDFFL